MAHPERFELPTTWFVARYSIQLSYGCEGGYYRQAPATGQEKGARPGIVRAGQMPQLTWRSSADQ